MPQMNTNSSYPDKQERRVVVSQGNQQSPGLTKWQLNTNKQFRELYKDLLGLERDPDGEFVFEEDGESKRYSINPEKQIINERGLHRVKTTVNSVVNPSTILSDIDEGQIVQTMREVDSELAFTLAAKKDEFDMDISDRDLVLAYITSMVHISLQRARDGGERDFLSGTESRHEVTRAGDNDSGGFISRLLPGGKK